MCLTINILLWMFVSVGLSCIQVYNCRPTCDLIWRVSEWCKNEMLYIWGIKVAKWVWAITVVKLFRSFLLIYSEFCRHKLAHENVILCRQTMQCNNKVLEINSSFAISKCYFHISNILLTKILSEAMQNALHGIDK